MRQPQEASRPHSHLVPLLVVGQDLGHVPVPGRDGLNVVVAAVGLEQTGRVRGGAWDPCPGAPRCRGWGCCLPQPLGLSSGRLTTRPLAPAAPKVCEVHVSCLSASAALPWLPPRHVPLRRRSTASRTVDTVSLRFDNAVRSQHCGGGGWGGLRAGG